MFQALMRVLYSAMVSKYKTEEFASKRKAPGGIKEQDNEDDSNSEYIIEGGNKGVDIVELQDICAKVSLTDISQLFMILLSDRYIN